MEQSGGGKEKNAEGLTVAFVLFFCREKIHILFEKGDTNEVAVHKTYLPRTYLPMVYYCYFATLWAGHTPFLFLFLKHNSIFF